MKKLSILKWCFLTVLIMAVSPQLKAQTRVNDGQYTSTVSFNWTDSVKKYYDLMDYYALKAVNEPPKSDKYFELACDKYWYYSQKIDSIKKSKLKHKLEAKYKIKLP